MQWVKEPEIGKVRKTGRASQRLLVNSLALTWSRCHILSICEIRPCEVRGTLTCVERKYFHLKGATTADDKKEVERTTNKG